MWLIFTYWLLLTWAIISCLFQRWQSRQSLYLHRKWNYQKYCVSTSIGKLNILETCIFFFFSHLNKLSHSNAWPSTASIYIYIYCGCWFDHGVHRWWNLIRSKQLFSAPYVACRCLPDFFVMVISNIIYIYIYIYIYIGFNRYRWRKWTRLPEFASCTRLFAIHIALIPLGNVWIQLFSLPLLVNSTADCAL